MKFLTPGIAGLVLLFGLSSSVRVSADAGNVEEPVYIDVRSYGERRMGYIPSSLHIPLDQLYRNHSSLSIYKNRQLVMICESGVRSGKARDLLEKNGFTKVSNLKGGMRAWREAGKAVNGSLLRISDHADDVFDDKKIGVLVRVISVADKTNTVVGLQVFTVFPDSPAEKAGIQFKDTITHINGRKLSRKELESKKSYFEYFKTDKGQNDIELTINRNNKAFQVKLTLESTDYRTFVKSPFESPFSQIAHSKHYLPLSRSFQALLTTWGSITLPVVTSFFTQPQYTPVIASASLPKQITAHDAGSMLAKGLKAAAKQFSNRPLLVVERKRPETLTELLDYIEDTLDRAEQTSSKLRQRFTAEELTVIQNNGPAALEQFSQSLIMQDTPDNESILNMFELRRVGTKVNITELIKTAGLLTAFSSPELTNLIKKLALTHSGNVTRETRWGKIIIGQSGNSVYRETAAVIIDFGGNDLYEFEVDNYPQIVIDVAGDDIYKTIASNRKRLSPFATKLLYDISGNDVYSGDTGNIATGVFGISLHVDAAGNDHYTGKNFSLGAGFFGVGILVDHSGNDHYESNLFSQGFGGVLGVGLLIDASGNDHYTNTGSPAAACPTCSFAQGAGIGVPIWAYGGMGALLDLSGADHYSALNYAQGVGYYGGFGILHDLSGNDQFIGGKFTQGAGVHGAIGILKDESGDDRYESTDIRSQGAAWDRGIGYLHDSAGNDAYRSRAQAQSFGAKNSIAVLIDSGGQNEFSCDQHDFCQGKTDMNQFSPARQAESIAIFRTDDGNP